MEMTLLNAQVMDCSVEFCNAFIINSKFKKALTYAVTSVSYDIRSCELSEHDISLDAYRLPTGYCQGHGLSMFDHGGERTFRTKHSGVRRSAAPLPSIGGKARGGATSSAGERLHAALPHLPSTIWKLACWRAQDSTVGILKPKIFI